jgi:hypothetical protein
LDSQGIQRSLQWAADAIAVYGYLPSIVDAADDMFRVARFSGRPA